MVIKKTRKWIGYEQYPIDRRPLYLFSRVKVMGYYCLSQKRAETVPFVVDFDLGLYQTAFTKSRRNTTRIKTRAETVLDIDSRERYNYRL